MLDTLEFLEHPSPNTLGRRIWSDQSGKLFFKPLQLVIKPVILAVRKLGPRFYIIQDIVPVDLGMQLRNPRLGFGLSHSALLPEFSNFTIDWSGFSNSSYHLAGFDRHPTINQMLNLNVLINFRPMQHPPACTNLKMIALLWSGIIQARETLVGN